MWEIAFWPERPAIPVIVRPRSKFTRAAAAKPGKDRPAADASLDGMPRRRARIPIFAVGRQKAPGDAGIMP
jgi:hypothetical protein